MGVSIAGREVFNNSQINSGDINNPDIDGGTIDGATIATSNITVGAGKTLDVSAGTLTLANDQISGDKVEGGTINATTITTLTSTTANITTVDTNVTAAKVTLSGTTLAAGGTDSNVDINLTPKGTGEVNITKVDIDAGTIDGTVIGGSSAAAGKFTSLEAQTAKVTGGTPGVGKILTSDAVGNASWENAPSGTVPDSGTTANLPLVSDGAHGYSIGTDITVSTLTTPAITAPAASLILKPTTDATTAIQIADKDGNAIVTVDTTNDRVGVGTATPSAKAEIAGSGKGFFRIHTSEDSGQAMLFGYDVDNDYFLVNFNSSSTVRKRLAFVSSDATSGSPTMVIDTYLANVGIGQTTFGTSAAKVLAIGSGTAPTTSPADAVQMWSQNNTGQGASGLAQLYIRDEYGISGPVMHALDQRDCENIIEDLSYYPPVTFTWDPGSLADGVGETSAAISVPGVSLGGAAVQCIAPYDLQGVTLNAYVNAADSCKARLQNETTGTIDLASGTWIMQARRI